MIQSLVIKSILFVVAAIAIANAQKYKGDENFKGCDYYKELEPGKEYPIETPGFPKRLPSKTNCRWVAVAPQGYRVMLICPKINLLSSRSCDNERFDISLSGNPDFDDAYGYCGSGKIEEESNENIMAIALRTKIAKSKGFRCIVKTVGCECGTRKSGSKIVGGEETGVNEFPMMAALSNRQDRIFCGATIISPRYVLTAAHCLVGRQLATTDVLVGEHDVRVTNETTFTRSYPASRFIIHEGYNETTGENDIALVMTRNTIQFSRGVSPVCLPFRFAGESFSGDTVEAVGWGLDEFGGIKSSTLMKARLDVITNTACAESLPNIFPSEICTFTPGKDACQYDSGGPLYYTNPANSLIYQVGIISYGLGCGLDSPAVNTRVTEYLNWILLQTQGTKYCMK